MAAGTLRLTFVSGEDEYAFVLGDAMYGGVNTFSLPLSGGYESVEEIVATDGFDTIPTGTYTVVLSYQDVYNNPAANDTVTNVEIVNTTSSGNKDAHRRSGGGSKKVTTQTTTTTIPSSSTTATNLTLRDLTLNSIGEDVKALQTLLISLNKGSAALALSKVGATGYFGNLTKQALIEYQKSVDITPAVGYFGPLTRAQMKSASLSGLWW
jgi:hypothetical protein